MDSRGRVIIPLTIREAFDLREGTHMMLVADLESKEVKLLPLADPKARLAEVKVTLGDIPGALAKVATILAKLNVDLILTRSRTIHRGKLAEWHAIVDISRSEYGIDELKKSVVNEGAAKEVEIRSYP
ncbi:MAG: ACT domain-containing protein [Candidatus Bathyarchaeia archaeon]